MGASEQPAGPKVARTTQNETPTRIARTGRRPSVDSRPGCTPSEIQADCLGLGRPIGRDGTRRAPAPRTVTLMRNRDGMRSRRMLPSKRDSSPVPNPTKAVLAPSMLMVPKPSCLGFSLTAHLPD